MKKIPYFFKDYLVIEEYKSSSFDTFITLGGEYELTGDHSVFLQYKCGKSDKSKEFKIITGLNFFPEKFP